MVTVPVKPLVVLLSVKVPAPSLVKPTVPPIASEITAEAVEATLMEAPVKVSEPPTACASVRLPSSTVMPPVLTAVFTFTV